MKKLNIFLAIIMVCVTSSQAVISYDQDVTPNVIFGDGNANGSFTIDQSGGVELGLRAKLRYDATGQPQNIFNSNGDGTYTFDAGIALGQSASTAVWSFEWSINTDIDGTSGVKLDDLTYSLSMTSTTGSSIAAFDPINQTFFDHAIGDNTTTEATNLIATDETEYANLIASYNVAQNSWKPHWFATPFDPTQIGTYGFTLTASNGASTSMTVNVVPEPATMALLGLGGLLLRKRRASMK